MALREVLARFGFELDDSALKRGNALVDSTIGKLTNLKGVIGGALAGLGLGFLKAQVDELASQSGEINKAAIKAGVGFEQFQRIQYQTGLSTEQLTISFRNLQLGMAAAGGQATDANEDFASLAEGGLDKIGKKKAGDALKKLGVDLTDAQGKSRNTGDVFTDAANALAKIPDHARQSALAIQIFGRSGQDILPFLAKGPDAIKQLGEDFDTFGGITEETRKTLKAYEEQQKKLGLASNALRATVLGALTPALTFLFEKINQGLVWFKRHVDVSQLLVSTFSVLTAAVVAFGGAAIVAWAKALAGPILVGAAVLLLIAIVDDLIHFFKGDAKTATEDLINLIFGKEAGESWIVTVRKDVHALVEDLAGAKSILEEIGDIAEFIASGGTHQKGNEDSHNIDVAVVNRGLKRKTRERTNEAFADAGEGYGEREVVGPTLAQAGKSLYSKRGTVEVGPLTTGPLAPAKQPTNIDAKQTLTVYQTINGADAKDAADQSVSGVKDAGKEIQKRQASLNAVEARK